MDEKSIPTIKHYSALVENVSFEGDGDIETCDVLVKELGVTVVDRYIYNFKPQGRTIIYVLAESHMAIHTWPEHKMIHIDLVTDSNMAQKHFEVSVLTALKDQPNSKLTVTNCQP